MCSADWLKPSCSSKEKRENHSPSARVSRAFLNSCNFPACLDQAIQTRKP